VKPRFSFDGNISERGDEQQAKAMGQSKSNPVAKLGDRNLTWEGPLSTTKTLRILYTNKLWFH